MTKKSADVGCKPTATSSGFIVIGVDEAGKPKGARFPADQLDTATAAAASLKLQIFEADKDDKTAFLAKRLPIGRIYARGKAFVPYIKKDLYDQLSTAVGQPTVYKTPRGPIQLIKELPRTWDDIKVGHVVLINEGPDEGYWEALVTSRDDDQITASFLYFSKIPEFKRQLKEVALLSPFTS